MVDHLSVLTTGSNTDHGDKMVEAIVSQDPNASILSITAMDANGYGTIGSIVAAMELAMDNGADIINLSLSAKSTLVTSVIASEIQKANERGIIVVASAGNAGSDVAGYVPGNIAEAYIIGSAYEDGTRRAGSNYGATVDYNVIAESTSETAALFTGFVSANGLNAVSDVLNSGLIYDPNYEREGDIEFGPADSQAVVELVDSNDGDVFMVNANRQVFVKQNGFRYSSVGWGDYNKWTSWYTHTIYNYNGTGMDITVPGICLQPSAHNPDVKKKLTKNVKGISDNVLKVMFFGDLHLSCSGETPWSYWSPEGGNVGTGWKKNKRLVIVHMAAGKLYGDDDWDAGANDAAIKATNNYIKWARNKSIDYSANYDQASGMLTLSGYHQTVKFTVPAGMTVDVQGRHYAGGETGYARNTTENGDPQSIQLVTSGSGTLQIRAEIEGKPSGHAIVFGGDKQDVGGYYAATPGYVDVPSERELSIHKDVAGRNDIENACIALGGDIYSQSGAAFTILNAATGAVIVPEVVLDAAGNADSIAIPHDCSDIIIREIRAPYACWPMGDVVVDLDAESSVTLSDPPMYDPEVITIQKLLDRNGARSGYEGTQGDIDYTGAKFRLYYANNTNFGSVSEVAAAVAANQYRGAWNWHMVEDGGKGLLAFTSASYEGRASGNLDFVFLNGQGQLPVGSYYLVETQAPKYFPLGNVVTGWRVLPSQTGAHVELLPGGSSSFEVASPTYEKLYEPNTPYYGLQIQKVDYDTKETVPQGDASLAGITFEIINRSSRPVEYPLGSGKTYSDGQVISGLTMTTNANGYAKTANNVLPVGTYGVREVSTNDSYLLGETREFTYTIKNYSAAEAKSGTIFWPDGSLRAEDPVVRGGIKIQKIDVNFQEGTPQGNASLNKTEFKVWNASEHDVVMLDKNGKWTPSDRYAPFKTVSTDTSMRQKYLSKPACLTLYCDGYGVAVSGDHDLPYGTYVVMETKAPPSGTYKLNTEWAVIFTVRKDGEIVEVNQVFNPDVDPSSENEETPNRAGVKFQKIDVDYNRAEPEGDGTLKDAIIAVYNDSQNPIWYEPAGRSYAPGEEIFRLRTDEHGYCETDTANELPDGDYYAIEVAAPVGYKINKSWKIRFSVNTSNYGTRVDACNIGSTKPSDYPDWRSNNMILKDNPIRGGVAFGKVDSETGHYAPQGDATLHGAMIGIWNDSAHPVVIGGKVYQVGDHIVDLMIGENGRYQMTGIDNDYLVYGSYIAREVKAPYGYKLNTEWEQRFTIRGREDVDFDLTYIDISDMVGEAVIDEPFKIQVPVPKHDADDRSHSAQGDATLAGAKIDIKNLSQNPIVYNGTEYSPSTTHPFATVTTDASGIAVLPPLPVGTYEVTERQAPEGYLINKDWCVRFQIIMNEDRTGLVYKELSPDPRKPSPGIHNAQMTPVDDDIIRAGVKLYKIDAQTRKDKPQGDASLEKAVFGIFNDSKSYVYVNGVRYEKGQMCATLETDENGVVESANDLLPYGTYIVREIDHSYGYYTNTDWSVRFSVRELNKIYDLNEDDQKLPEQVMRAGVEFQKIDHNTHKTYPQGNAKFAGAEVTVYNVSKESVVVRGTEYGVGEACLVIVADNNGVVRSKIDDLPVGTYYAIETKAPEGYYLNEEWRCDFAITEDDRETFVKPKDPPSGTYKLLRQK